MINMLEWRTTLICSCVRGKGTACNNLYHNTSLCSGYELRCWRKFIFSNAKVCVQVALHEGEPPCQPHRGFCVMFDSHSITARLRPHRLESIDLLRQCERIVNTCFFPTYNATFRSSQVISRQTREDIWIWAEAPAEHSPGKSSGRSENCLLSVVVILRVQSLQRWLSKVASSLLATQTCAGCRLVNMRALAKFW